MALFGILGAVGGLLGGLFGGGAAKGASREAEAAQIAAQDRAIAEQRRQFDVTRADYAPLTALLAPSTQGLADFTGLNGDAVQAQRIAQLKQGPEYESLYRNGLETLLQTGSATGGLRGGNYQTGLANFGADTLSQLIGQQMSRLGGITGLATGATDSVSGFGAQSSNNISNILMKQGDARASGALTRGGINAGMWNSVGGFLGGMGGTSGGGFSSILKGLF